MRGDDVFIVACGSGEVNDNLIESLILINACKNASVSKASSTVQPVPPAVLSAVLSTVLVAR